MNNRPLNRRELLKRGAAGIMAGAAAETGLYAQNGTATEIVSNGRIRQSIMGWCFRSMDAVTLAAHCKEIGLVAMAVAWCDDGRGTWQQRPHCR